MPEHDDTYYADLQRELEAYVDAEVDPSYERGEGACLFVPQKLRERYGLVPQEGYWYPAPKMTLDEAIEQEWVFSHCWNADGDVIVDATAGQFLPSGSIVRILHPSDPLYACYLRYQDVPPDLVDAVDNCVQGGSWAGEMRENLDVEASKRTAGEALPVESGWYYRSHHPDRPFSREDAQSQSFTVPGMPTWDEPSEGYSAYSNPHHLAAYIEGNGWSTEEDYVLRFRGEPAGFGADGEYLVVPTEPLQYEQMAWPEFLRRLESTPDPGYAEGQAWTATPSAIGDYAEDFSITVGGVTGRSTYRGRPYRTEADDERDRLVDDHDNGMTLKQIDDLDPGWRDRFNDSVTDVYDWELSTGETGQVTGLGLGEAEENVQRAIWEAMGSPGPLPTSVVRPDDHVEGRTTRTAGYWDDKPDSALRYEWDFKTDMLGRLFEQNPQMRGREWPRYEGHGDSLLAHDGILYYGYVRDILGIEELMRQRGMAIPDREPFILPGGKTAALEVTYQENGRRGESTHITMEQNGTIPTAWIEDMPGVMGERPGEHRNRQGQDWEDFKAAIATDGIIHPIFITVEYGESPRISEGNHRRDAAVELGLPEVPVQVRYFGKAEEYGTLEQRMGSKTASGVMYHLTDEVDFEIDPEKHPANNTTTGIDIGAGIYMGDSVEAWVNGYGYWRPWVVEIEVPPDVRNLEGGIGRGYSGEVFVPAEHLDKLHVRRVVPLDAHCREQFGDWGWTEDYFGTTFDTEQPFERRGYHDWDGYRYPGDARQTDVGWQRRYEERVSEYERKDRVRASVRPKLIIPERLSFADDSAADLTTSVMAVLGTAARDDRNMFNSARSVRRTGGPGSGVVPDRVRAAPPADLYAPRPISVERVAEQDIRDLDPHDAKMARSVVELVGMGKVPLEAKTRPPLVGCFSVDVGDVCRLLVYPHVDGSWRVFYVGYHDYDEAERRMATAGPGLIARGLSLNEYDESFASKVEDGSVQAEDFVAALARDGHGVGLWWGVLGEYGDIADFEDHAQGSMDPDLTLRGMIEEGRVGADFIAGEISVILTAKRPMRDGAPWDPEIHNPGNGLMGNSYLDPDEDIELVEIRYDAGWGWRSLRAAGISTTARTAEFRYKPSTAGGAGEPDPKLLDLMQRKTNKYEKGGHDLTPWKPQYRANNSSWTTTCVRCGTEFTATPKFGQYPVSVAPNGWRSDGEYDGECIPRPVTIYRGYHLSLVEYPALAVNLYDGQAILDVVQSGPAEVSVDGFVHRPGRPGMGKSWTVTRQIADAYAKRGWKSEDPPQSLPVLVTATVSRENQRRDYRPAPFMTLPGFEHENEVYLNAQEKLEVQKVEVWDGVSWRPVLDGPIRVVATKEAIEAAESHPTVDDSR